MDGENNQISEQKYTISQVAEKLGGISRRTVYKEVCRGQIGHYRIGNGRIIMIGETHLKEYLTSRERQVVSEC
jgi:excisionase family DNA binding protein